MKKYKSPSGESINNILSLIQLGFFPPELETEKIQKKFLWKVWDTFRGYCKFAKVKKPISDSLQIICTAEKEKIPCRFSICPILSKTIKKYQ